MLLKSIIFLGYLTLNYGFNTVLNIEELNSIHYNIDIVSNPVLKEQEWTTDIVTVINKQGQEYVCTLPKVEITENENKKDEDILDQLVDISELLKPMEAAPCIIKRKDWWSYEFCYGSVIKQYHLEDNKVTGTILILGKYESEYNWRNSSETKNKLQKFHSQFYVNGTRCDITGEPRRTEVRFHCEEGVGDYIQQVEEPESCRYVLTIATTRLCHHPYLRPSPNRSPHSISCAPALNQEQYEKYEKIQISKKEKSEHERQLFLDNKNTDGISREDAERGMDEGVDEDTKWSIQLVTIPMSKKGRNGKAIAREFSEKIGRTVAVEEIHNELVDDDAADVVDHEDSLREHLKKWSSSRISEDIQSHSSYLTEEELMEKEIDTLLNDIDSNKETENKDSNDVELDPPEKALKQIRSIRNKMNKMMGKWMEIQNDEHMQELSLKIDKDLAENEKRLEDTSKLPSDILSDYVDGIIKITNNYKTEVERKLVEMEDLDTEEELKLVNILETLKRTLTDADKEVLLAKKRIQTLEKMLESKFNENKEDEQEDSSPDSSIGDSSLHDGEMGSSSSLSTHPSTKSDPQIYTEEDSLDSNKEDLEDGDEKENLLENSKGDTRQVRILNEKSLDEFKKSKLEQSIKERLQNSGLDHIGRKIEVKILTPNYLDDEEKDSLTSLSQEDTEAFHNMIVNILSASAEEMQERERHKSMESNYNFQVEDVLNSADEESEHDSVKKSDNNSEDVDNYNTDNVGDK